MDEIYAEAQGVVGHHVSYIVTNLVFFLVAKHGKRRDARDELVVAVSLETRNCARCCRERKCQREALRFVPRLRQMQAACVQHQRANPIRRETVLLTENEAEVIVMRGRPGGRQRPLLHQGVVLRVTVRTVAR